MRNSIARAKQKIRSIISKSNVPEDPIHAENVLEWVLKLEPYADEALQFAALAHDIDRAVEKRKILRSDFNDYDAFKATHAKNLKSNITHPKPNLTSNTPEYPDV
jgi:hypothetical protein